MLADGVTCGRAPPRVRWRRDALASGPRSRGTQMPDSEHTLAVFVDFENLALGWSATAAAGRKKRTQTLRHGQGPRPARREGQGHRQDRPTPTGAASSEYRETMHDAGIQMMRDPRARQDRQEPRGHPAVRRRDGPVLQQGAHRHVRHRLGRLRLHAARVQAQGERQERHRARHEGLDVATCSRAAATSSSTTRTSARAAGRADGRLRPRCPRRSGRRCGCSSRPSRACSARTRTSCTRRS